MNETARLLLTFVLSSGITAVLFKWRFDIQLENLKASPQRDSQIHARQLSALLAINSSLKRALFYLSRATSAGKLAGDPDENELLKRMGDSLKAASEVFSENELLFGPELIGKLGEFFSKITSAGYDVTMAVHPALSHLSSEFWSQAREKVNKEIPPVPEAINAEARRVIHR